MRNSHIFLPRISFCVACVATAQLYAGDLQIAINDGAGHPVSGAVLIASSDSPANSVRASENSSVASKAIMDQANKAFAPEVLVVRTGTAVSFPNSDVVAHQVYSFSRTKRFSLPLYRGRPYPPVTFDQPGIVTLGCNIHDFMVGYVVVTDSPHFLQSDAQGQGVLRDLAPGTYRVSAWHPRFAESVAEQAVVVTNQNATVTFKLTKPLQSPRKSPDRRVRDY
jgi:plastocyanin